MEMKMFQNKLNVPVNSSRILIAAISSCAFYSIGFAQAVNEGAVQAPNSLTNVSTFSQQSPKTEIDPNADLMLQYGAEASVYRALSKKLEAQLQAINRQAEVEKVAPGLRRAPGPVLIAVEGLKDRGLTAFIELVPGAPIQARMGDALPNGMFVEAISFETVTLRGRKGQRQIVLTVPQYQNSGNTVGRFMTSEEIKSALADEIKAKNHKSYK